MADSARVKRSASLHIGAGKEKVCSKCGVVKAISEFNKRARSHDALTSACRDCLKAINKPYRVANAEKARETSRLWRLANPEWVKKQNKEWYIKNREKAKRTSQTWRTDNYERHIESVKQWRKENPEKAKEYDRKSSKRIRSTPKGKLKGAISAGISHSLQEKKAGRHWEMLVGYTLEQLKKHIEGQFTPAMTWENYGTVWHIDHKIPLSAHNYKKATDIDFRRAWSLGNLQPLDAKANLSKGAKIDKPFQPALAL